MDRLIDIWVDRKRERMMALGNSNQTVNICTYICEQVNNDWLSEDYIISLTARKEGIDCFINYIKCSYWIGAWKWNFPSFWEMLRVRSTKQRTDVGAHREVTLPIIGTKSRFVNFISSTKKFLKIYKY